MIQNEKIRLVKKDTDLALFIVNKLNLDEGEVEKVIEMLSYNVFTTLQVAELTGLTVSTLTNKCRPIYKGGQLITELDVCYPFQTITDLGPKFIFRNEKLDDLLRRDSPEKGVSLTFRQKLVRRMYSAQKGNAKARNQDPPDYSIEAFEKWILENPDFEKIYLAWAESGYQKMEMPSCDRIDNDKSYSLDNLRVCTLKDNITLGNRANIGAR